MMNRRSLDILVGFRGYGNPKRSYWFIGIEESLSVDGDEILEQYRNKVVVNKAGDYRLGKENFKKPNKGSRYTAIYDIIGKIVLGTRDQPAKMYLQEFLHNELFFENGVTFQANLFPLGKRGIKEKVGLEDIRNFGLSSIQEYYDLVHNVRFPMLFEFWTKNRPVATVCFGKSYWSEFRKLFGLSDLAEAHKIDETLLFYPDSRIFLVPFFRYGLHMMNHQRIAKLSNAMRRFTPYR